MIKMGSELYKDEIDKVLENILDKDIEDGTNLLTLCNNYHNDMKMKNINNCKIKNHKEKVLDYLNAIKQRYSFYIRLYNSLNENNSSGYVTDCNSLEFYVEFLKRIKRANECVNDKEKYEKIMKGEIL